MECSEGSPGTEYERFFVAALLTQSPSAVPSQPRLDWYWTVRDLGHTVKCALHFAGE